MLSLEITKQGTTIIKWRRSTRRQECEGEIEITGNGRVLNAKNVIREVMPDDFDPEIEARRMKQGGCCGQSTESSL